MKYTFVITAWNEPDTVRETLSRVLLPEHGNSLPEMEIVLVCPDAQTHEAAQYVVEKYNFPNFIYLQDPQKGKPYALNLALEKASGNILIFTDGDVVIGNNSLPSLIKPFDEPEICGVSGRPISADDRKTMFGYWGNILADAAHHKRSTTFQKSRNYYMSGYLYAMRRIQHLRFPDTMLVDDAWISLKILESGKKLAYASDAHVFVKYPRNFSDWLKQKKRSIGGYRQLEHSTGFIEKRTITSELEYMLYPLAYARNLKEFIFSLLLYPARLYLWVMIFIEKHIHKKSFDQTWVRIESTK